MVCMPSRSLERRLDPKRGRENTMDKKHSKALSEAETGSGLEFASLREKSTGLTLSEGDRVWPPTPFGVGMQTLDPEAISARGKRGNNEARKDRTTHTGSPGRR